MKRIYLDREFDTIVIEYDNLSCYIENDSIKYKIIFKNTEELNVFIMLINNDIMLNKCCELHAYVSVEVKSALIVQFWFNKITINKLWIDLENDNNSIYIDLKKRGGNNDNM